MKIRKEATYHAMKLWAITHKAMAAATIRNARGEIMIPSVSFDRLGVDPESGIAGALRSAGVIKDDTGSRSCRLRRKFATMSGAAFVEYLKANSY